MAQSTGAKSNRAAARRMRKNEKAGLLVVFAIIAVLAVAVVIGNRRLEAKDAEYAMREARLEAVIESEEARTEELNEQKAFVQTKKYIEEIARDKLNLVYPNEILFKEKK